MVVVMVVVVMVVVGPHSLVGGSISLSFLVAGGMVSVSTLLRCVVTLFWDSICLLAVPGHL